MVLMLWWLWVKHITSPLWGERAIHLDVTFSPQTHKLKKKNSKDLQTCTGTGSHMKMTQLGNSKTLYFVFGLNECASCLGLLAVAAGMDTSMLS